MLYGYLIHHGIKGQKWGIRRFQNPDGSLTTEGIRRYGVYSQHKQIANKFDSMTNKMSKNKSLLKDKEFMDEYKKAGADWENELKKYKDKDYRKSIKTGKKLEKYGKDFIDKISSQKPTSKAKEIGKKVVPFAVAAVGPLAVAAVVGGGGYLMSKTGSPSNKQIDKVIKESLKD